VIVGEIKAIAIWGSNDIVGGDDHWVFDSLEVGQGLAPYRSFENFDDGVSADVFGQDIPKRCAMIHKVYEEIRRVGRRWNNIHSMET